ncbi:MAG: SDR family oxidoreductase [Proteobacteria bacterium]|nr:SDR family oxidoreductase [Pseudomonadota bacterium]MBW3616943.1 SDR family oxidoreductase [Pseudomonadota bacterium]
MRIDLSGKAVLVTGASRGIGVAIARGMAGAGARVAVHYGRGREAAETLAAELGQGAEPFGADLADADACGRLWADVERGFGRIDVLVNNAGVAVGSPLDVPDQQWAADWDRTLAVNLRATALLSRAAIGHFQANGGGRIVTVASRAAFRGDAPDYLAYAASKAGQVALTRSVARAYGRDGITAFVVAPGFTRTEMAQEFIDRYGPDVALRDNALGRFTEPEDIAPAVVFLASGLADHATGTTIDINAASYVR